MLKSESEIKSLPLEELQKLVVELGLVQPNEKDYASAKALLAFATGLKKYKAPEPITVTNEADFPIPVDGKIIPPGETGKVYAWQFTSLSRWLSKVEGATAKAAALIALIFLLGSNVTFAQTQPYVFGSASTYNVVAINGYYGWTNVLCTGTNAAGLGCVGYSNSLTLTNLFLTQAVTNTTSITTNANWAFNTGIWTNTPTYTTNVTVNYPGMFSTANYDMWNLFVGAQFFTAGSGTNLVVYLDTGNDGITWNTNALSVTLLLNGTTYVGTNLSQTLFAPGYVRIDQITESGNLWQPVTNLTVTLGRKPSRTGP